MSLPIGSRLGPYEILASLGAGGMGEVYKALDTRLDRTVAIKIGSPQFIERFEREARAIAALSHPHICALYDIGPDYLVMEYLEGAPLQGPLPVEEALELALQIAAALAEAHGKGVIHRDLKPGNILVTAAGAKLLDFGLAKREQQAASDATLTQTAVGTVVGTAAYMSPEQAEGRPVDARSDIFAFGLVLYEMLSGQQAFTGATALSTMVAILHHEPLPLQAPPEMSRIVTRCLRKSPDERFQTMAEVMAALKEAGAAQGVAESNPSIAVLPFANMSAEKENEYFSDGLAEEILNALTQVPGLKVTARTSAFSFRGKDVKIGDISRELGVAHVLEGSVRKSGNRIRVTAQLVKAADGFQVWSERYDRELTDVFAIQDEISAAIVSQLKVNLTGSPQRKPAPRNMAAYEAVLEGRHHWYRFTPASAARALQCYECAVAADSGYAPAHAGLADYYFVLAGMGLAEPKEVLPKAAAEARRTLELDPKQADAHSVLGMVSALLDYDWGESERHFRRALELNPASPHVRFPYAFWCLRSQGRLEEALAELDRVLEQDPLSAAYRFGKAAVLIQQRRYEAAEDSCRRALDLEPNSSVALMGLAYALAVQRRFEEARSVAEQFIQVHGRWHMPLRALADVHSLAGNAGETHRVLDELHEMARRSYVSPSYFAMIHCQLGETDAACEWVEKAIQHRDPAIVALKTHPTFDPLRADPRFPALLRQMNLA